MRRYSKYIWYFQVNCATMISKNAYKKYRENHGKELYEPCGNYSHF